MGKLKVSRTNDYLERDGKYFFYFADTIWSAFTAPNIAEWEEYLDFRRRQGFNALQINILPQWDASEHRAEFEPFEMGSNGRYLFSKPNAKYFDRACQMLGMARERGFTPALVLLWCNYVPETWGSDKLGKNVIAMDEIGPYVRYVLERFRQFDPIYMISGDTDFQTPRAWSHYMAALKLVKELCPDSLTTMHIGGERSDLPEEFVEAPELDFYTYQSSHNLEGQHYAYHLAEAFMGKKVRKPIVNAEPCYEGHGYGGKYGRFTRFDVRLAVWQSLLSGAKAGVAYGAHGVWSFHREGAGFASEAFSSVPFNFRDALRLEGAWDIGFAKWVFETFKLNDIWPARLVLNDMPEIRSALSEDNRRFLIYVPYAAPLRLNIDVSSYSVTVIELGERHFLSTAIPIKGGNSMIPMQPYNADALIIGMK
jgi:hypothetical protein